MTEEKPKMLRDKEELEKTIGIILAKKQTMSCSAKKHDQKHQITVTRKCSRPYQILIDAETPVCICFYDDSVIFCEKGASRSTILDKRHGFTEPYNFHADCMIRNYVENQIIPEIKEKEKK